MSRERPDDGIFVLPGGLIAKDGRQLREVELRPLSGREEEWLASHPGMPSARAVTHVVNACLVRLEDSPPSRELVRRLLVGDRDYLMLQLRRITFGNRVTAVLHCPACASRIDVDFLVQDVAVEGETQVAAEYPMQLTGDPGHTIHFRLPTGADQEAVLDLDPSKAVDTLLDSCLVGSKPVLSVEQQTAVMAEIETRAPRVELELDVTCPECQQSFVEPFDTTAFFLDEVRQGGGQLLREVHTLAFYYHWSEAEILGLTRARRRAYLSILGDALRPD